MMIFRKIPKEADNLGHTSLIKSNNTTRSNLETSLNASGQNIYDDNTLHVEQSKPKGAGKQNFCFYCKKFQ